MYCAYCLDDKGNLRNFEEVQLGVAHFLGSWQTDVTQEQLIGRAERYLTAMPVWASRAEK